MFILHNYLCAVVFCAIAMLFHGTCKLHALLASEPKQLLMSNQSSRADAKTANLLRGDELVHWWWSSFFLDFPHASPYIESISPKITTIRAS